MPENANLELHIPVYRARTATTSELGDNHILVGFDAVDPASRRPLEKAEIGVSHDLHFLLLRPFLVLVTAYMDGVGFRWNLPNHRQRAARLNVDPLILAQPEVGNRHRQDS